MSLRVTDADASRKLSYDFLLVISSTSDIDRIISNDDSLRRYGSVDAENHQLIVTPHSHLERSL